MAKIESANKQKSISNKEKRQLAKEAKVLLKLQKKEEKINNKNKKKIEKENLRNELRIERNKSIDWFKLDNAGTLYPSINNENWNFVVRVSATLKKAVNPEVLQESVKDTMHRFPSFNVRLRSGFFWNYFEEKNTCPKVKKEWKFPCSNLDLRNPRKHILRVLYYNNRISIEVFHGVADGRSMLKFLNSILRRYFVLLGEEVEGFEGTLNPLDMPKQEEITDAFIEYYNDDKKTAHKEKKAYRIRGTQEENGVNNTTIGKMSVDQVKMLAKEKNCTITAFLVSVLALSMLKRNKNIKRPIKISIPIDLRTYFPSETLRNFSGYINVEIHGRKEPYVLDEVIEIVKEQLAKVNKEYLSGFINSNAGLYRNWLIKIVPLFIKNLIMKICFKLWGEAYQTMAVSNIGIVKAPKGFENLVSDYGLNLGRPKYNAKGVGVVSFGGILTWTFSSRIKEMVVEKDFFNELSNMGVNILIENNRRDIYGE